jgi:protein tyrosine phosphatase (PTP) superfamily phosphohydrolase (DUF442 family)
MKSMTNNHSEKGAKVTGLFRRTDAVRSLGVIGGALIILTFCLVSMAAFAAEPADDRPASWAQPIELEGVPNLHRVSAGLYRSAQPTALGMRNLRKLRIKTVVNLRAFHSDRDEIGDAALGYEHIYMKTWHPEREDVVRFLRIVTDPSRAPFLVHCQHGADRTGAMVAWYRIAVQGWTKQEAIREMTEGGFGFHAVWENLPDWIEELDVDSIRRDAGINAGAEQPPAVSAPDE